MRNKKPMLLLVFVIALLASLAGGYFTGCGDKYANMKLDIKGDSEIVLYTDPENEEQSKTASVQVSVSGVSEAVSKGVIATIENTDCIAIEIGDPDSEGMSEITIIAKKGGTTKIKLVTAEGGKTAVIAIKVIERLKSISVYANFDLTVYTDSVTTLDPVNILSFNPSTTSQKDVKFELVEAYDGIEIVKNNGISSLVVADTSATQVIRIKATSVEDEQPIENVESVEFNVYVIEKLNIETVTIQNLTLSENLSFKNNSYEVIDLTSNSRIDSKYRTNTLQIVINPKTPTEAKFLINDTTAISHDSTVAELSRTSDPESFMYDVTGVSFGDTSLQFVITIDGFAGYEYVIEIPVHVVELPSVVSVNDNTTDFNGTLFTIYDTYGYKFNVTVGSSNTYDFRYEIRCDSNVVTLFDSTGGLISLMDIEGETYKKSNPRNAQATDVIYAVAKAEAIDKDLSSSIMFVAYATLEKGDAPVVTTFNFSVSQGVKAIELESFENNTIYVEKNGTATLNYTLSPQTEEEKQINYDDGFISYKILTNGGEETINVRKSTEEQGQFVITGLKNAEKVSLCITSANGVYSTPVYVTVFTPGTFVTVTLPAASTNNNILETNYSNISYSDDGSLKVSSLSQPFSSIDYNSGMPVVTLSDNENADSPVFAATIAKNTTQKFTIENDPSNKDQSIVSTSYKFVVPEVSGNTITFRDFNAATDKSKGTINPAGYIQTTGEGTMYVLVSTKFLASAEENGKVKETNYYRLVAINSYPKITNVNLQTLTDDVVYNKQGLGDIDIMTSTHKTYNYTKLTIGPESATSKEILRSETTSLKWTLEGLPSNVNITKYKTSDFVEFNEEATLSLKDIEGVAILFDTDLGAYEFADTDEVLYTGAYLFFNFDDNCFGQSSSVMLTMSVQLTQFNSSYIKSISIIVKRPVVATSIDLGQSVKNVSTEQDQLLTKISPIAYELYIDSRNGINELEDVENLTVKNANLANSWQISATMNPSNVTNGILQYVLCDGNGEKVESSDVIKVLSDGTVVPLNAGLAYIKLVPMSGELASTFIIKVRVADGEGWETAYKIYNQTELMNIAGTSITRYTTMKKYYELANDIYLDTTFAPIGVYANDVVEFSGGLRGYNDGTKENYSIYNFEMKEYTATVNGQKVTYAGLFGYVTGDILDVKIVTKNCDLQLTDTTVAYVGTLAGRVGLGAKIKGVEVVIEKSSIYSIVPSYIGGIAGLNDGLILDNVREYTYESGLTENLISRTRIKGEINVEISRDGYIGGIAGENGMNGSIISDFNYFSEEENFNNANDNVDVKLNVNFTANSANRNIGGVAGVNKNVISNVSSVALIDSTAENAGGIVGLNYGTLNECYFIGTIQNADNVGGIAGKINILAMQGTETRQVSVYKCIAEILDSSISTKTIINGTRIMGNKNVGGLVGYADFDTLDSTYNFNSSYNTIEYSYVRSYLPLNNYSDIALTGATGNIGGLVGYAKNLKIKNSYAILNITIEESIGGLNVGGLVGKLENVVFSAMSSNNATKFSNNIAIENSFTTGNIIVRSRDAFAEANIGQLVGLIDLDENNTMAGVNYVINQVYTAMASTLDYDQTKTFYLVGLIENTKTAGENALVTDSYYLYTLDTDPVSNYGTNKTLAELQNAATTLSSWANYSTDWRILAGNNNDLPIIYINENGTYLPFYTIVPTSITLNIKEYTPEDEDQLFTRVDSNSTTISDGVNDVVSKSAVLYIYNDGVHTNIYNIKDIVKILTVPLRLNNSRYVVVSDNDSVVMVDGDKFVLIGEGTSVITICSVYNKEVVYDCIQLAVVNHNFEMVFLDNKFNEYTDEDIIMISKSGSEQVIVYVGKDSTISGFKFQGDLQSENESAIVINGSVLGSNISLIKNNNSLYNNTLSIMETGVYEETTLINLTSIPYFNVKLYTNPLAPSQDTLKTREIYNTLDYKYLNILVYVGATEITFNTNNVSSAIGNEIAVTVTLHTDYENDTLLMFYDNELIMSDDNDNVVYTTDDFTIAYDASTKTIDKYYDSFDEKYVFSGLITYKFTINASGKYLNTLDPDMKILYTTINSAISFAGRSCYLAPETSAVLDDYSVKNTFNFAITPAIVNTININNFAAGRTVSGKYVPEDPSFSIVPGEVGLIQVQITPAYAGIKSITIKNASTNYTNISLLQVLREHETGLYTQVNSIISNTDSGVNLISKSELMADGSMTFDGNFYIRTLLPTNIPMDYEFSLIVTAVFEEDGEETTKVESITLISSQSAGIFMDFAGENYAYIVKGTSLTPRTKVVGFTGSATYNLAYIEPTVENFFYYFDEGFTSMFNYDRMTEEEKAKFEEDIVYLFNDQVRVDSSTGEIFVGVLIKKGVTFTIEASIMEYMNNGGKLGTDTINVYVVDYLIEGITVQGAVHDTLTAVCNIPKTLKIDFIVNRADYYDYKYDYLEDLLAATTYRNVAKATEVFFGNEVNSKSNIDIEIEKLLREINTYDTGVWMYTSDSISASVKEFETIVIGETYDKLFEVQSASYEKNSNLTCFALRIKEITTLTFKANVKLVFAFNQDDGSVTYTFNPDDDPEILGDVLDLDYEFYVSSVDSSSQDNPLPIYDQDKFIQYVFETEDTHFILLTDIVLENWEARDTSIASLDGNGYTITIKSFKETIDNDDAYFGLFKKVSENTILSNIHLSLGENNITLATSKNANNVYVGLFACENNGTIFNCSVTSEADIKVDVETKSTNIKNSLFVMNNTSTGAISNSRVGYIDGTNVGTRVIHFYSYNDMAGFVVTNSGHIASCFAKDISLTCKELTALNIDNTGVAGFAVTNTSLGKIFFSYVEGIRGNDTEHTQIQLSDLGYKTYNTGIYSPGNVAGFVYTNNGFIQDTYANIPLISPTSSTGFVYTNNMTGTIQNAFSVCLQPTTLDGNKEEYPNTSRSQFTGIDDLNQVQNKGQIVYAYYFNAEYDTNIFAGLGEPALALPEDSFRNSTEEFGNFASGNNMVWTADPLHPQLVSANRVIRRQRYLVNNLTGEETDEMLEEYIYNYEDVIDGEHDEYGSYSNPIVISSGVQFVAMSDEIRLVHYKGNKMNLNMNDYIVIKDIDLEPVIDTGLENLQSITYAGMLEGNGYTFKNVSILSEKSSRINGVSFGMFEQIGAFLLIDNDVVVTVDTTDYHAQIKNMTIEISAISGTHATAVGTLAGIIVNADILNINIVTKTEANETVTVQGERYVGAVAGYVAGNSTLTNITSDISITADFRNDHSAIENIRPYIMGNNNTVNYTEAYKFKIDTTNYTGGIAGGIAGLIDCFTIKLIKNAENITTSLYRNDYDKTGYNYVAVNFPPQVSTLRVSGKVKVLGDVVGGVVGLNYSGTHIYNARFILELGEEQKISGELIAGGLIGMNYGKIDQSCLTHEDAVQTSIDELTIEKTEISQELFYEESKFPIYVGGLVGYNIGTNNHSGVVTNCYSRANVNSYNASYVGGMIGYMNNGYLQYCYVSGNVISSQEREDEATGKITGTNGIAAGAVAHLVAFTSKNAIKYFAEYTGLSYYSLWSLVVANDWEENVNVNTTAALLGRTGSGVRLEDKIINGDMDIFVNNMDQRLDDVLYCQTQGGAYNIVNLVEGMDGSISRFRLIASYTYETFKAYYQDGANPDENILYQTWDRNIWDVEQPYFPKLLLHTNSDQNYITNEDQLRAIGTSGFYIIQNDIYLTKDWIPKDGFEGTLTSKKKKDGTYCTVYNININGECYNTSKDEEEDTEELENVGNVGFFSSVKDKAYIYNVNFVFGGNIWLPQDYEMEGSSPVHVQRTKWETYDGTEITTGNMEKYKQGFVNGITNNLDYATVIANNVKDLEAGLFTNTYGTGAVAGVATNATFSNITVSFSAFMTYSGNSVSYDRASINANTPYIGGFIGYASNCKIANCQITDNPIQTYVKSNVSTTNSNTKDNIYIPGDATINVYNNGYINTLTQDNIKGIVTNYTNLVNIARIICDFYQEPQCVGGFIGKLDSASNYITFNGRTITSHINVYEKYENGEAKYYLPSPNLNIGGLIGYSYVANLTSVNVTGTIVTAVNTTGIDVTKIPNFIDEEHKDPNSTELNIGGVIGVADKGTYRECVYMGTIKIVDAAQKNTPPKVTAMSKVNIGGVMGKLVGDITLTYGIFKGYENFTEVSGYSNFKEPIVIETKDKIKYMYIGGILGNAETLTPRIMRSLFSGNMYLGGTVNMLYVGGILGNLDSSAFLTNRATIQYCYTLGTIYERAKVESMLILGGVIGKADKVSASSSASTMEFNELGSSIGDQAVIYAGDFAGYLGYSTTSANATVNDCFTAGMIRIDKADPNGAIGGLVGVMFGHVKNSYTATTIISIADNNPVTIECTTGEAIYKSTDGIIGPMFGFCPVVLETKNTTTAFYVFDYTGCVMRSVEAEKSVYGVQIAVSDITKECVYGTSDPIMSIFAGTTSTSGSWKTLTYGDYIIQATNAYSLPILTFLESDAILNSYCKFCETSTNERINILIKSNEEQSNNAKAQEYQLYYGAKLYPYLLKAKNGYKLDDFRRIVVEDKVDVSNSYFAMSMDFDLTLNKGTVAFNDVNFHILGYGNRITLKTGAYFAEKIEKEMLMSSVNFDSDYGIIKEANGIIYNVVVSGDQEFDKITNTVSSFIEINKGLVVNSGVIANVSIKDMSKNAKYAGFVAVNEKEGIINSCFSTGVIYIDKKAANAEGSISGFAGTIKEKSHILNIISATAMNVIDEDALTYKTTTRTFVETVEGSDVVLKRIFVDKLANGYEGATDFTVTKGGKTAKEAVVKMINLVNTSYLVNSKDESPDVKSGMDTLRVMVGSRVTEDDKDVNLAYALAGRNYNYDYMMAYNYGYPFPSLITYYKDSSLFNALSTGNGISENPYKIQHAGKLDWIRSMMSENAKNTNFALTADIYMNVYESFYPLLGSVSKAFNVKKSNDDVYENDTFEYYANLCYKGEMTTKAFTLDGKPGEKEEDRQYIIYYLKQNVSTDAGLFFRLTTGQNIVDLAITYADIKTTNSANPKAGVLAATIKDNASVTNVGVFNSVITVTSDLQKVIAGGLVGNLENMSALVKCSAEVKINVTASSNVMNIGGLIGQAKNVEKILNCYVGSNINLLDNKDVHTINKTNLGGIVGKMFDRSTYIEKCMILTSFNYAGLTGYKYNLDNFKDEASIKGADALQENAADKITDFLTIGNIVGAVRENSDSANEFTPIVKNCYMVSDITMVSSRYIVGGVYNKNANSNNNNTGLLTNKTYNQIVAEVTGTGNNQKGVYSIAGVREGSKIKPYVIGGDNTIEKFANRGEKIDIFTLFGILDGTTTVRSTGVDLNGKFIYGNGNTLIVSGCFTNTSENCIFSKIKVGGTASGSFDNGKATGLIVNNAKNCLINECEANGEITASAEYVGGLVGQGEGTLIKDSTTSVTIQKGTECVGGLGGKLDRGGYWHCKAISVNITGTSKSSVGGIAGWVPQQNSFMVWCNTESGTIEGQRNDGNVGGLIGKHEGLLVGGKVGTSSSLVELSGHNVGGVVGEVRKDAKDIYLNGFTVYIDITYGANAGGIVSFISGNNYQIVNSKVNGSIKGDIVGGIAGYTKGKPTIGDMNSDTYVNKITASIESEKTAGKGQDTAGAGGVVGRAEEGFIYRNEVTGKVKGKTNVGGIAGITVGVAIAKNKSTGGVEGEERVGGVVGYVLSTEISTKTEITEHQITSSVTGNSDVGGIVGITETASTIKDNKVSGRINGKERVGGIAGRTEVDGSGSVSIASNTVSGSVNASDDSAGGLVGYMSATATEKNDVSGNITGKKSAGGVAGEINSGMWHTAQNGSTIKDDYIHSRTISASEGAAGGLVGIAVESVNISTSTEGNKVTKVEVGTITGKMSGDEGAAGGLIGMMNKGTISDWNTVNVSSVNGKFAGGLVGKISSGSIRIKDLKTVSKVKGSDVGGYIGNIAGGNMSKEDKDVTISNISLEGNGGSMGAIAGYAKSADIKKFIVGASVTYSATNINGYGGLVGYLDSGSIEQSQVGPGKGVSLSGSANQIGGLVGIYNGTTIKNSTFTGSLGSASNAIGGLVGKSGNSINADENTITITSGLSATTYAGGLVGESAGLRTNDKLTSITYKNNVSAKYAGGAIGYTTGDITLNQVVIDNGGNIDGIECGGGYVGAGTGRIEIKSGSSIKNSKDISGTRDSVGGVVGSTSGEVKVDNVTIRVGTLKAANYAGGIAGYASTSVTLTDVKMTGMSISNVKVAGGVLGGGSAELRGTIAEYGKITINSTSHAGGVVGSTEKTISITLPGNNIDVSLVSANAGGIAGHAKELGSYSDFVVKGSIKGTSVAGGLGGDIGSVTATSVTVTARVEGGIAGGIAGKVTSSASATTCSISGAVSGSGSVGGIFGEASGGSATSCKISGGVSTTSGNVGGIIGKSTGASIENCTIASRISGGSTSGGYAGTISGARVSGNTVSADNLSFGSASTVGGMVGYLGVNATVNATIQNGNTYTYNPGYGENKGKFVGVSVSSATVNITCSNASFFYLSVSGHGGIVGNNSGTIKLPGIPMAVDVSSGGGIAYSNSSQNVSGPTYFYYQATGGYGAWSSSIVPGFKSYIHCYGGSAKEYASYMAGGSQSVSDFGNGSNWPGSLCGASFTFPDNVDSVQKLYNRGYTSAGKVKEYPVTTPLYIAATGYPNIFMQCNIKVTYNTSGGYGNGDAGSNGEEHTLDSIMNDGSIDPTLHGWTVLNPTDFSSLDKEVWTSGQIPKGDLNRLYKDSKFGIFTWAQEAILNSSTEDILTAINSIRDDSSGHEYVRKAYNTMYVTDLSWDTIYNDSRDVGVEWPEWQVFAYMYNKTHFPVARDEWDHDVHYGESQSHTLFYEVLGYTFSESENPTFQQRWNNLMDFYAWYASAKSCLEIRTGPGMITTQFDGSQYSEGSASAYFRKMKSEYKEGGNLPELEFHMKWEYQYDLATWFTDSGSYDAKMTGNGSYKSEPEWHVIEWNSSSPFSISK